MITTEQWTKNTDELLAHFAAMLAAAEAERPDALISREVSLRSARDAEWHTLFAVIQLDAMAAVYDTGRVAARLDEMRMAMIRRAG